MENIICIDLTSYNQAGLEKLSTINPILDRVRMSYSDIDTNMYLILEDLKVMGYAKLYIDSTNGLLISYTMKGKDKSVKLNDKAIDGVDFSSIKPIEFPKREVNIDTILDKISNYGMESLSSKEKLILESKSKG